ncbi:MAG: DUF6273 domain-containing protein [Propionibacteriaceae bacterium]|jgi:hypothetical protein|nr:DUF6273 domain-containing protein [Propionibacteriaceae bacterium]
MEEETTKEERGAEALALLADLLETARRAMRIEFRLLYLSENPAESGTKWYALCITKDIVSMDPFDNPVGRRPTNQWDDCELKQWLNGGYPYKFPQRVRDRLHYTDVGRKNVRIFPLPLRGAQVQFRDDADRVARYQGEPEQWWLCEPALSDDYVMYVGRDGAIHKGGWPVRFELGVRPAFWLDLNPL